MKDLKNGMKINNLQNKKFETLIEQVNFVFNFLNKESLFNQTQNLGFPKEQDIIIKNQDKL